MLHAEDIVSMAKDAERYRWIRDSGLVRLTWALAVASHQYENKPDLDGSIDAAMKAEQE